MPIPHSRSRRAAALVAGALSLTAASAGLVTTALPATAAAPSSLVIKSANASGLPSGAVKHVWLIILENKSYDATFTGLNKNSYLWQNLPQQGVLLKNYYGTGHFSQDNYESMVSGQAPEQDTQSDCDVASTNFSSNSLINGTANDANYGQAVSAAGANAKDGKNGCVYPSNVPTLFNQLDAAGKTWKGYAQDLGNQPGREDGVCGYPGTASNSPTAAVDPAAATGAPTGTPHSGSTANNTPKAYAGVASFTGVQAAGNDAAGNPGAKEDGYVAKHFPFPWFHSLSDQNVTTPSNGGTDCDANHIANLDDANQGLVHDLQSAATTPDFNWITPNNCSDAHDAVCKGNNLSGAFNSDGSPNYNSGVRPYDPQGTTPTTYTGGLYASDLFLRWYVPLIEKSAAFQDGGLIDVTFDEGNPAFVNSSFNNANDPAYAPGKVTPGVAEPVNVASYLANDAAGQNINGVNVASEPTGPNTPNTVPANATAANNDCVALPCPGPGDSGFIDRTPAGARTDTGATAAIGSSNVSDNSIGATDPGRGVTCPAGQVTPCGIPANSFVGPESNTGPNMITSNTQSVTTGTFQLVDANGNAVPLTAPITANTAATGQPANGGITLTADSAASGPGDHNYDPIYDPSDFTPGGGDTGSVLISPFIKPGTSSTTYYNHYSWLRTMEDIFDVSKGTSTAPLAAGTISGGLDGQGHIGFAAQNGLAGFGPDVFNNAPATPAAPAAPAKPQSPAVITAANLTGSHQVGQPLTANPGTFNGAPTFSYQWLRNGKPIPFATKPVYHVISTDYKQAIACLVTATNTVGSTQTMTPSILPLLGKAPKITRRPVIFGRHVLGARLSTFDLGSSVRTRNIDRQWLRNGKAIKHATFASYKVRTADLGKSITCRVTVKATGYANVTVTTGKHFIPRSE